MARCANYISKRLYQTLAKKFNEVQEDMDLGPLTAGSNSATWAVVPPTLRFQQDCCSPWVISRDADGEWSVEKTYWREDGHY